MIKILEWISIIITLIGAVFTSLGFDPYNVYFLNFGSLLWSIWAFLIKEYGILIVNIGMLCIYIMGSLIRIYDII